MTTEAQIHSNASRAKMPWLAVLPYHWCRYTAPCHRCAIVAFICHLAKEGIYDTGSNGDRDVMDRPANKREPIKGLDIVEVYHCDKSASFLVCFTVGAGVYHDEAAKLLWERLLILGEGVGLDVDPPRFCKTDCHFQIVIHECGFYLE